MNQIVTNPQNSKTSMQVNNHKLKARLVMRAAFLALCAVCLVMPMKAENRNVLMQNGSTTITADETVNFYDSHGPSHASTANGNKMEINYWDRWYASNEANGLGFTYTFNAPAGYYVKVEFKKFVAYGESSEGNYQSVPPVAPYNCTSIGEWALRINDDWLYAYEGTATLENKLIGAYTGNTEFEFSIIAQGAITFKFVSNSLFREEGWYAEVTAVPAADFAPTAPFIRRSTCSDQIELVSTTLGSALYYSTGSGTTPSIPYNETPIDWPVGSDLTVSAMSILNGVNSEVATAVFDDETDRLVTIDDEDYAPIIQRVTGENKMSIYCPDVPEGLNETFFVSYTTGTNADNTPEPTRTVGNKVYFTYVELPGLPMTSNTYYSGRDRTYVFDWNQPSTYFKAKVFAFSCHSDEMESPIGEGSFDNVYVPKPEINVTGTYNQQTNPNGYGSGTITCSLENATIYYTLDGSEPTTSSPSGTGTINLTNVAPGTTIKAMAYVNDQGYTSSPVVSFLYVPTGSDGQSQNGVFGATVMLDDREDHSWSYYSDGDQPVHSLNPKDVKITYFGNGITMKTNNNYTSNTSTDDYETSTGVAVGVEDNKARNANQFIYLKTLENENTEGTGTNYPYTTIPNPFSKRPVYGTVPNNNVTSFTGWRGFQGWRVKAVKGGSIGYSVGAIIPAETVLNFQPTAEYGMEVEFEAVWARAYVSTDRNTTLNGGSYERNFYVLTGNIGNNNIASPGTVSRYYPNGTTNGRDAATAAPTETQNISNVSLNVDTKYEYIALSWNGGDNNYLTANNHYLCFGRGISTNQNAARVRGMGGASTSALNYMIRIESGRYDAFGFIGNGNWTMSSTVLVKSILGCDYDRANNKDNSKLEVSRNSSMFYSTGGVDFSNSSNMDQKVFDCVVKSGTYQSQVTNDGAYDHSLYCGHNSASAANGQKHYPGVRYITVEGGALASLNGGRATDGWQDQTYTHDAICFSARIKGGTFRGSIYGGAADNPSGGSKQIIITGGTVQGWVAGGANGTGSVNGSHATTNGNSYIYVGGNSIIGSTNPPTINETPGGNIFGAGRGRAAQMASIDISNVVIADNTTIYQNVYGGGYHGTIRDNSNVYILGGTVMQNVFGGAYGNNGSVTADDLGGTVSKNIPSSNVYVRGGEVKGSVYGGSYDQGTVNNTHVNMTGGKSTHVYGGGKGVSTVIGANTTVVFAGGETGDVYGGGELGTVGTANANGNTDVTFTGGKVQNVYGAGLGSANNPNVNNPTNPNANANIYGNTTVTIGGGTVSGSVFGGGENGSVAIGVNGKKSTVAITNGTINGSVFGGGSKGFTNGATLVNVSGGVVKGSVFGGAYGTDGIVYVNGVHTVNVMGNDSGIPEINGSVYGGSRLANDGNSFTLKKTDFDLTTGNGMLSQLSSVVNISGARIREHVYAAGYYGQCFGSVYVNIGTTAIENTTTALGNNTDDKAVNRNRIFIEGSVWAGGDWGVFEGDFGGPTITGHSNVVVDGTDYNVTSSTYTTAEYMGIGMSVLGCGTSSDAGKQNRNLLLRNYGTPVTSGGTTINPVSNASRELKSIQRFKNITFDNAHVSFAGQGKMNSLNTTEKYSLYSIVNDTYNGNVYVANGSTLVMNQPSSELNSFRSVTCSNPYASSPTYNEVTRDALYGSELNGSSDNKIRVNGGSFVEVKYNNNNVQTYGELQGYFHMMSSNTVGEATCAYARPKQATDSHIANDWDNQYDGGFLSYDTTYNTWNSAGKYIGTNNYQLPYENHAPASKSDSQYFRVWEFGGNHHNVDGIITVQQVKKPDEVGYQEYRTVDVTIQLPAWRTSNSYYRFDRVGSGDSYFTNVDYGIDVMAFNAANTADGTGDTWMYFQESPAAQVTGAASTACPEIGQLSQNPDMNFGLIIMPGSGMTSNDEDESDYIICGSSDSYIAKNMQYNCSSYNTMPTVTFRLTYKNNISSNTTWDPITIPLVQCDENGVEKEYVNIHLTVNTMTEITSDFKTQVYAIMNNGSNTHATTLQTIVLPTFELNSALTLSNFTLLKADFTPGVALNGGSTVTYENKTNQVLDINSFGLTMEAVLTPDNSDDWRSVRGEIEAAPGNGQTINDTIAESGGRTAVALGFHLYYSEVPQVNAVTLMGTVVFTVEFDNYKQGDANHKGQFTVTVDVYRKGPGVNFYVDGVNGKDELDNEKARGKYPNFAAKSVEYVLSRLGYTAGDNIYIVNTVDVKKALRYDGSKMQNNVNIWRYPGNHQLKPAEQQGASPTPIQGNTNNEAFKGLLFNLKSGAQLTVIGTKIDGMYAEAVAQTHDQHIFPTQNLPEGAVVFDGKAEAPVFNVNDGAKLTLNTNTSIQNNYNNASAKADEGDAGGVYIASGAVLAMNQSTHITSNYNSTVGGVYMDGSMIVSDDVVVYNNKKSPEGTQSNVWLTKGTDDDRYKVVQIGDADLQSFGPLTENAHIGIDKDYGSDAYTIDYYLPVVFTETANEDYVANYLEEPYQTNRISLTEALIVHDKGKYRLEKYMPDNYLYWLSTWVTFQDHEPNNQIIDGVDEGGWDGIENIHTPQQLAWFISLVNGENGESPSTMAGETVKITADISMDGHIWVPIGTDEHPFKGTFEGNGHVITDMYGSLVQSQMGMFGNTVNANIQNAVVKTNFTGTNDNLGTVIGTMNGGTLSNVEGAGSITNKLDNCHMGGLVGNNVGGTIHSGFAVADMTGGAKMGGLVGKNTGDLYNAYSHVDFAKLEGQTSNMVASGLVAENTGTVENCYVIEGDVTGGTFYTFSANNTGGTINFCYASESSTSTLVGTGDTPNGSGTYGEVLDRKAIGYMYADNAVSATNDYVVSEITYTDVVDGEEVNVGHITKWPGLLSTLNQWVAANPKGLNPKPTTWFRSTSSYLDESNAVKAYINGDLPILGFPKDNSLATEDGKFLYYGACDEIDEEGNQANNGLDNLFETYADKEANMFLYGKAVDVTKGNGDNMLFINEDAVLLQKEATNGNAMANIKAVVGVTFDNSSKSAHDYYGTLLEYDWHLMSTPLRDAPLGITYTDNDVHNWWENEDDGQVDAVSGSYMPDGIDESDVKWDFYTYFEPEYHWINFKRNINSHHHYDEPHDPITYTGTEQNANGVLTPGRGYMMAINKDSYLSNNGTLNNGVVSMPLTVSGTLPETQLPSKDWGSNLIGNPYQAYLDLDAVSAGEGNGAVNGFYVYNADNGTYGPYMTGASINNAIPSKYIHPHQGFFAVTTTAQPGFKFTYDMATATKNVNSYYRNEEQPAYPVVNLFVENAAGNRDMAVVELNRPEIGGVRKVDNLRNANFKIAAHLEGTSYGLVFTPEGTDRVPVRFQTEENGTFTLTWSTYNGDFSSLLLVDNMTGTITDMLRSDHYTFDATTDDYASRFYITFAVTDVEEYNEGDNDFAWFDGSEWVINGKGNLDVVDVLGRTIYSERLVNDQNRVNLNNVAKGVYMLRVSEGNSTKVQKVVVR